MNTLLWHSLANKSFWVVVGSYFQTLLPWVSDYSNLGYIIHKHEPYFAYTINKSLVIFSDLYA